MATLYLTEPNATLRTEHNRFVVEKDGKTLATIHDFNLDRVIVIGNAQLTTHAVAKLLDTGIDTAFLSPHGKLRGRLAPIESKNSPLRMQQYEQVRSPEFCLTLAKAFVAGKIDNCSEVLSRHQRNHAETDFSEELNQLSAARRKVQHMPTPDALRGLEGHAAAVYFSGFARMLRRSLSFTKRTRRPPTDPVNALLSFGYTLLTNEAISAVAAVGFDPYLGFFHTVDYGRCSLALDLIEEFRPLTIDRLTVNLINLNILDEKDFTKKEDGGFYLEDAGRKRFFAQYEEMFQSEFTHRHTRQRTTLRRALHDQAQVLQQAVVASKPYVGFRGWF